MSKNNKAIIWISVVAVVAVILCGVFLDDEKISYAGIAAEPIDEYKININTADYYELKNCPDMGDETAMEIISYRNENGKFASIYDLIEIEGIGEKKLEKWEDYLCAE
ncbi:MAG: helix-hairpin-helix domain-containing protein [Clostridia bacterium]|nr:helix-hairpin-helix domain-containing protein [Clostridia bacterium]